MMPESDIRGRDSRERVGRLFRKVGLISDDHYTGVKGLVL